MIHNDLHDPISKLCTWEDELFGVDVVKKLKEFDDLKNSDRMKNSERQQDFHGGGFPRKRPFLERGQNWQKPRFKRRPKEQN